MTSQCCDHPSRQGRVLFSLWGSQQDVGSAVAWVPREQNSVVLNPITSQNPLGCFQNILILSKLGWAMPRLGIFFYRLLAVLKVTAVLPLFGRVLNSVKSLNPHCQDGGFVQYIPNSNSSIRIKANRDILCSLSQWRRSRMGVVGKLRSAAAWHVQ